jgi:protein-L-isoaspartate(D-aspartate) O-methyltransferase
MHETAFRTSRFSVRSRSGPARWRLAAGLAILAAGASLIAWLAAEPNSGRGKMNEPTSIAAAPAEKPKQAQDSEHFLELRRRMVRQQMQRRDITDGRVLAVMERVPRHLFVPEPSREAAYDDHPLPIGQGQTISQPYIVALMTQLAQPKPKSRALDIGTGSGYQAAVLAELCQQVYSIEIVESLAKDAQRRLADLGFRNVEVRSGDGYRGWPQHAPFDLIIVAAAPDHVPDPLVEQLAPGGRLVIPVGRLHQNLLVIEKQADGQTRQWKVAPVAFVPMTGEALYEQPKKKS